MLPTPKLQELLSEEGGEELVKAVRRYADRTDLAARNEQGLYGFGARLLGSCCTEFNLCICRTPLHEACEAHAVYAVLEFIRLKAPVTIRAAGGNTQLHLLFRSTKWQEFKVRLIENTNVWLLNRDNLGSQVVDFNV